MGGPKFTDSFKEQFMDHSKSYQLKSFRKVSKGLAMRAEIQVKVWPKWSNIEQFRWNREK